MIKAYAAFEAGKPLGLFEYQERELKPHDVEISISHCGVCHSDLHLVNNDWGMSHYPMVPGHEIIGKVVAVGSAVTELTLGERVGVGWQCGSCFDCEYCETGHENLCAKQQATCVGNFGGFADAVVVDSRFAFRIPDALNSANAAPLLCGGITVFAPMKRDGVKAGMKVGVIGIGGLGHFALQFASKMGAEVTAFSTSPNKEAEAMKLGAHRFVVSSDPAAMAKEKNKHDYIISTVSADINWMNFMAALKPNGKLTVVGAAPSPLAIPAFALIGGQKSIGGSAIGSRAAIKEMLEFAANHNVGAIIEELPMSRANEALEKVQNNTARYRMVLSNS